MAVYGLILTQSFGVITTCAPYLVTALVGMVVWNFFSGALSGAVGSLVQSTDLITKLYFPRESLPMAAVTAVMPDLIIGALIVIPVALIQGVHLRPIALLAVVPAAMIVLWAAALGIVLGVLAAFYRDTIYGVSLALRLGFFASPVVYEAAQIPEPFQWTVRLNPVAVAITEIRNVVLCGTGLSPRLLTAHLAASVIALIAAVSMTRAVESRVADII